MTLTYNLNLAKVKVDLPTECEGRRSNGSGVRALTNGQMDGQTDRCYQVHYLPASLSYAVDNNNVNVCMYLPNTHSVFWVILLLKIVEKVGQNMSFISDQYCNHYSGFPAYIFCPQMLCFFSIYTAYKGEENAIYHSRKHGF